MERIRIVRNVELANLDALCMRVAEAGDPSVQARVARRKQHFRDISKTFDLTAYTSPDALKGAWHAESPGWVPHAV